MFGSILELSCAFVIFWFIITQMIMPTIRGKQMFPVLRNEGSLHGELREVNQKVEEKSIRETIRKIKKEKGVK